ncbi:prepilin-type N-terminal cleavage/methylation domain-containing protein [bacterium]|nr:prepilin-type N-terminal cleavage/methylation domain-containing protein [bacterium]
MTSYAKNKMKKNPAEAGFTLIEIIIAIGILASLSLYAVRALTNQIETRNKLQLSNEVTHAAHAAMMRLAEDLRHAYILTGNEEQAAKSNSDVIGRPMFVLNNTPRLMLMTQAHQSLIANRAESNLAYAQYIVCPDLSAPSGVCRQASDSATPTKQLVRIVDPSLKKVADDAVLDGVSQVLVNDLKELKLLAWNGQDFLPEWNTERSDFGKKLPKMVKIELSVFMTDDALTKQARAENLADVPDRRSLNLSTIVYLMYSAGQADLKEPKADLSWVP